MIPFLKLRTKYIFLQRLFSMWKVTQMSKYKKIKIKITSLSPIVLKCKEIVKCSCHDQTCCLLFTSKLAQSSVTQSSTLTPISHKVTLPFSVIRRFVQHMILITGISISSAKKMISGVDSSSFSRVFQVARGQRTDSEKPRTIGKR